MPMWLFDCFLELEASVLEILPSCSNLPVSVHNAKFVGGQTCQG
jgi:hypothetical protein